ncbi:MAG: hypothetical protein EBU01_16115 [Crocinitomicaceae bacterium]|nr:hypothetical protein [Crocinitomicaceae bacterium]
MWLIANLAIIHQILPFVMVSFFGISSVINQDVRAFGFISGLLISLSCISLVSKLANISNLVDATNMNLCYSFSLLGNQYLSNIPLNSASLTYTFGYLLYPLITYGLVKSNIFTIVLFSLLCFGDLVYSLIVLKCTSPLGIFLASFLGLCCGLLWGLGVDTTNNSLLYFTGIQQKNTCKYIKNQTYQCRLAKIK